MIMTKRQKECLDFIRGFWRGNGYAPSYQEIADALGMKNKSGAYRIVENMCNRGVPVKQPSRSRSIALSSTNQIMDGTYEE